MGNDLDPDIREMARRIVENNWELLQRLSRGAVGGNPEADGDGKPPAPGTAFVEKDE